MNASSGADRLGQSTLTVCLTPNLIFRIHCNRAELSGTVLLRNREFIFKMKNVIV